MTGRKLSLLLLSFPSSLHPHLAARGRCRRYSHTVT